MKRLAVGRPIPTIGYEAPPSVAALRQRVPLATYSLLSEILSRGVHYKNDICTPLNSYLSSIFPPERGFLVGPQTVLRPVIPDQDPDDPDPGAASDVSYSSAGGIHIGRYSRECRQPSF